MLHIATSTISHNCDKTRAQYSAHYYTLCSDGLNNDSTQRRCDCILTNRWRFVCTCRASVILRHAHTPDARHSIDTHKQPVCYGLTALRHSAPFVVGPRIRTFSNGVRDNTHTKSQRAHFTRISAQRWLPTNKSNQRSNRPE